MWPQSRVDQANASLRNAQVTPKQVEAIRARAAAAEAQAQRSKAALDQAQLNLGYTTIVAPVDGVVGKRSVQVGQNVAPGQDLMAVVPAARNLGHREFQGNSAGQDATRPARTRSRLTPTAAANGTVTFPASAPPPAPSTACFLRRTPPATT